MVEVEAPVRLGRVRHRARRQQRDLPALHQAVDREGDKRGDEQDHRDDRAHLEVLLADHLLVDVDASMLYWPPITFGTPKSVMTRVKTTKAAEIRP